MDLYVILRLTCYIQRIYSYASTLDKTFVAASCLAAFGSGLTMPAMYVLFGTFEATGMHDGQTLHHNMHHKIITPSS